MNIFKWLLPKPHQYRVRVTDYESYPYAVDYRGGYRPWSVIQVARTEIEAIKAMSTLAARKKQPGDIIATYNEADLIVDKLKGPHEI